MPVNVDPQDPADDVPVYSKDEVDALLAGLAVGDNVYTKAEVDQKFSALPPTSEADVDSRIATAVAGLLRKPVARADLAADVQASLTKADTAVQPTPQPPPPATAPYISQMSDIDWMNWRPDQGGGGVVEGSHFKRITTPSGPGFEVVCTDANQAAWSSSNKAVLAVKNNVTALGQTQDWKWDMYLPAQSINVDQYVLWQWHTNSSSGHNIGLNRDGTYRLTRQSAYGQVYERNYTGGPPIVFDRWHPCRIQVKWSLNSDGFLRMWIDNKQVMNFSGATQFANDGTPYLQFGWYGIRPSGVTNTVRFGNIQRAVT